MDKRDTIDELKASAKEIKEFELVDEWKFRDADPRNPGAITSTSAYMFKIDGDFYTHYPRDNADVICEDLTIYISIWDYDGTKRFAVSNEPYRGADEVKILSDENLEHYATNVYK